MPTEPRLLSEEELQQAGEAHSPVESYLPALRHNVCRAESNAAVSVRWPCETAKLLAHIAALTEERERLSNMAAEWWQQRDELRDEYARLTDENARLRAVAEAAREWASPLPTFSDIERRETALLAALAALDKEAS